MTIETLFRMFAAIRSRLAELEDRKWIWMNTKEEDASRCEESQDLQTARRPWMGMMRSKLKTTASIFQYMHQAAVDRSAEESKCVDSYSRRLDSRGG